MKLYRCRERSPHRFGRWPASLVPIATLGLTTIGRGSSRRAKAARLRGLTLFLLGLAILAGSMTVGPSVRARQEGNKPIISPSISRYDGGALMQKLMRAPSIPGASVTVEAQATVDVTAFHQAVQSANTPTSSGGVVNMDDRRALLPADNTAPAPTVVPLPTPLGLQSSTDIPDFSMGASGQFIVNANSQTIYFQDNASNILASSTLAGFFANAGDSSPFGPMVYYDDLTSRWFIAALDSFGTSQSSLLLGVSHTSDPTMTWGLYKVTTDSAGQTSAGALSNIGGNTSFLVLSTAQFQNAQPNQFQQSYVFEFDKNKLITNNTLSGLKFTDSAYLPCPAQVYDTQYPFVDILTDFNGNSNGNGIIRHGFIGTNAGQVQYIPSAESLSFPSTWAIFPPSINFLPQQGSSTGIDGGDGRIANAIMRNNMLFGVHSVYQPAGSPNHQAIHWLTEDLVTGATMDGFFQGGGSTSYFKPSLAVNQTGGLLIAFNSCSPTSFPGSEFRFRLRDQVDFSSGPPTITSTGPSVALKNGINVGPTTSFAWKYAEQAFRNQNQGDFLRGIAFDLSVSDGAFGQSTRTIQVASANPLFGQGTIFADNGSASRAAGPPQGTPPNQYILGNLFPSNLVGGMTITGMQFPIPNVSGSIQPGQQLDLYYGLVTGTTPNGAPLTTQPFTVGQLNQLQTFTFPQPIPVPIGQGFYAGVSGAGGQTFLGVDTNVPLFRFAFSSPNGLGNFSADPVNFMVRLTTTAPPPCTGKLKQTQRAFSADGKKVCIASGNSNCKPSAVSDVDWVVVDDVGFVPERMEFNVLYHVLPNTGHDPRIGEITVGGQVFTVIQAGNDPLAPVTTTPNSAPASGSGVKLKINQAGKSNSFGLTPSATGFTSTTTVAWDGEERPTTFVSATEIDADIPASDLATQGTVQVSVFDLAPGGGTSPSITFTITAPGPDFGVALDQPTITAQAGTKARVAVNITRTGGFTGNVTITPPASQSGIKAKPADPITSTDPSVAFKLKISGTTPSGTYQLLIKGTDDSGREHDVTLTLIIQ